MRGSGRANVPRMGDIKLTLVCKCTHARRGKNGKIRIERVEWAYSLEHRL